MSELSYKGEAASAYDRAFAHVSAHFLPFLFRAGCLGAGQRVLDAGPVPGSRQRPLSRWSAPAVTSRPPTFPSHGRSCAPAPSRLAELFSRARGRPIT